MASPLLQLTPGTALSAFDADGEVAPVGAFERAGVRVGAGRMDAGAGLDELGARSQHDGEAGGRSGFDENQRPAGEPPGLVQEPAARGGRELVERIGDADDVVGLEIRQPRQVGVDAPDGPEVWPALVLVDERHRAGRHPGGGACAGAEIQPGVRLEGQLGGSAPRGGVAGTFSTP